jgi:hypothetical protein
MLSKLLIILMLGLLVAWAAGCAGLLPERKLTEKQAPISEEDIKDDRSGKIGADDQRPEEPGFSGPPAPPAEQPSGFAGPSDRPPRRLKFRDRRNGSRGWEPVDDGSRP